MKLYEVPRGTKVRVIEAERPPLGGLPVSDNEVVEFFKIDGMYSFCRNVKGDIVHLPAWTEVEIV
jgi:hypothetical protein